MRKSFLISSTSSRQCCCFLHENAQGILLSALRNRGSASISKETHLGDGMGRGLSSARSELRGESGPRPLEALKQTELSLVELVFGSRILMAYLGLPLHPTSEFNVLRRLIERYTSVIMSRRRIAEVSLCRDRKSGNTIDNKRVKFRSSHEIKNLRISQLKYKQDIVCHYLL